MLIDLSAQPKQLLWSHCTVWSAGHNVELTLNANTQPLIGFSTDKSNKVYSNSTMFTKRGRQHYLLEETANLKDYSFSHNLWNTTPLTLKQADCSLYHIFWLQPCRSWSLSNIWPARNPTIVWQTDCWSFSQLIRHCDPSDVAFIMVVYERTAFCAAGDSLVAISQLAITSLALSRFGQWWCH